MAEPNSIEIETLARCKTLLRFAAENAKNLPESAVSTICAAWNAQQEKSWDEKIATEFWLAFNSLCTLVAPVTIDTLSANLHEVPHPKWAFWVRGQAQSLSKRSARRYLVLLLVLIGVSMLLSFFVSTAGRLGGELDELVKTSNDLATKIVSEANSLESLIHDTEFTKVASKQQPVVADIQTDLEQEYYLTDQMYQKLDVLSRLRSLGLHGYSYDKGSLEPVELIEDVRHEVTTYYDTRRTVKEVQERFAVTVDIIKSFLLPVILGLVGACAYIVRLVSEEIKTTTFATTSPIRHLVRFILGGLAGVAIGFGGIVDSGSLSSSALAFIAGYAVEPVFATFDSIAEKFRK